MSSYIPNTTPMMANELWLATRPSGLENLTSAHVARLEGLLAHTLAEISRAPAPTPLGAHGLGLGGGRSRQIRDIRSTDNNGMLGNDEHDDEDDDDDDDDDDEDDDDEPDDDGDAGYERNIDDDEVDGNDNVEDESEIGHGGATRGRHEFAARDIDRELDEVDLDEVYASLDGNYTRR